MNGQITGVLLESVIAGLLGLLVAAAVHLLLWRLRRETYLLLWGLAWTAFAIRYLPLLWSGTHDPSSSWSAVGTLRDLLFVAGCSLYTGRRWWRWWIVPAVVEGGSILLGSLRHPIFGPFLTGARGLAAGGAVVLVAVVLAQSQHAGRASRRVSIAGLLVLAGVLFLGPVLAATASALFVVLFQLGVLATVVGISFTELEEASAQRLAALKKLDATMQHALRGHANVCGDCNGVEAADGAWRQPEEFIRSATSAPVTHGICPPCAEREFGLDLQVAMEAA